MDVFNNGRDIFTGFDGFVIHMPVTDIDIVSGTTNYLQREEKILSLLRRKKGKEFHKDQILELVKSGREDLTKKVIYQKILSEYEGQYIAILKEEGADAMTKVCEQIAEYLPKGFTVSPGGGYEYKLLAALCKKTIPACIRITIPKEWNDYGLQPAPSEWIWNISIGGAIRKRKKWGCFRLKGHRESAWVSDFQNLVTELYLARYLSDYFASLRKSLSAADYLNLRIVGRISRRYLKEEQILKTPDQLLHAELLKKNRILSSKECTVYNLLYCEDENPVLFHAGRPDFVIWEILFMTEQEYVQKKQRDRHRKILSGEYAKSFQTKKNIPQKVIDAMENSGFNSYFGYVEFDEECDLSLLMEIYQEYEALVKEADLPVYKDTALRFRKLGHHKASGLYYPGLRCLCVDIRTPGSMAHEVGHMIDDHMGEISETDLFTEIYDRYKKDLLDYMEEHKGDETVKVLKGGSKYNLSYYLQNTEVFARCFEIYLSRCKGIDNSLCRQAAVEGFAYPKDEGLTKMIEKFYEELSQSRKNRERSA